MGRPTVKRYTADFEVSAGYMSVVLIFSSDYTGTVDAVAFAGANDAELSFADGSVLNSSIKVTVSAGNVRVVTT